MQSVTIKTQYVNGMLWFRGASSTESIKEGEDRICQIKGCVRKVESENQSQSWLDVSVDANVGVAEEDLTGKNKDLSFQICELVKGCYESLTKQFDKEGTDIITLELKVLHRKNGKI